MEVFVMSSFEIHLRARPALRRCAVVAGLIAAMSVGAQESLSLPEALKLAEARSTLLASSDFAAQAARERGIAAAQLPDPVLKFGLDNVPINGPDQYSLTADFMTMRRVGVMQEISSSEKRDLRRQRGDVEAEREIAVREATRASLRTDVALAWIDRYYAQKTADLWRVFAADVALQITTLQAGIANGRSSAPDLRAAEVVAAQTADQISAAEQQGRMSTAAVARWLGPAAARPPGPAPDAATLAFDPDDPAVLGRLPQIAVLRQESALALTDLRLAEHGRSPDWSVEVAYQQRGPAYSNMVSIGVAIPLPMFPQERQDRGISASQAQLAQADAQLQDMQSQRRAELATNVEEWRSLKQRAQALQRTLLPYANDRAALALASYSGGNGTLAAVLEARRASVDARMQVLLLERDAARAWARLNFALVDPIEGAQPARSAP
jgi:outer membrane protein TolC